MKLHQWACAAPPWTRTMPGSAGSPHDSALTETSPTSTRLTVGRVARALVNHAGAPEPAVPSDEEEVHMRPRSSRSRPASDEVLLGRREAVEADGAVRRGVRTRGEDVDHVA